MNRALLAAFAFASTLPHLACSPHPSAARSAPLTQQQKVEMVSVFEGFKLLQRAIDPRAGSSDAIPADSRAYFEQVQNHCTFPTALDPISEEVLQLEADGAQCPIQLGYVFASVISPQDENRQFSWTYELKDHSLSNSRTLDFVDLRGKQNVITSASTESPVDANYEVTSTAEGTLRSVAHGEGTIEIRSFVRTTLKFGPSYKQSEIRLRFNRFTADINWTEQLSNGTMVSRVLVNGEKLPDTLELELRRSLPQYLLAGKSVPDRRGTAFPPH